MLRRCPASTSVHVAIRAHQEAAHVFERLLRRREPDALQRLRAGRVGGGERFEALERQREVRAALVAGERVDLVDDDRLDGLENPPAALAGEQDVERLGRGHQDVRRLAQHRRARLGRRVAGAHEHADLGQLGSSLADFEQAGARGFSGCRWPAP